MLFPLRTNLDPLETDAHNLKKKNYGFLLMEHISHGNNDDETTETICKYIEDKLNHLIMKNKKVITVLQDTNSHVITYHKASII